MANKVTALTRATQNVMTRASLMQELNKITQDCIDDNAHFATDLSNEFDKPVCGFVFSGYTIKARLTSLLDKLGIKYGYAYRTPKPGNGEIQINPEYTKQATELFANWISGVRIDVRMTGNKKQDSRLYQIIEIIPEKTK